MLLAVLAFAPAWAQTFTAATSAKEVSINERFHVTYKLDAQGGSFKQPNFNGFEILSGPNQSTSMQWVQGKMSSSLSYSFVLRAPQKGTFTIEPATIVVNGNTITSNGLKVKVVKGKKAQQQGKPQAKQPKNGKPDISKDVFLRCFLNKEEVFLGEQVVATFKIYTRLNIVSNALSKTPSYNGFYSQDVEQPANAQLTRESVNGQLYNVAVLKQTLLYPQRSGELEIDPIELDVTIRMRAQNNSRSPFDQFFGRYKNVEYTVASASRNVTVKPLPNPKPKGFSGAVGDYSMEASINRDVVTNNEALDLQVTFRGTGNVKLLEPIDFEFPSDFEVYDPDIKDRIAVKSSGMSGSRTFKYLIIPRHPGAFEIEPVNFAFFNPKLGRYVELASASFPITVERGEGEEEETMVHRPRQADVVALGRDIRYVKPGPADLHEKNDLFFHTGPYYGLMGAPFAILFLLLLVRRRVQDASTDTVALKGKRANKVAAKHLAEARAKLEAKDSAGFYEAIFRALYGFVSDKLNIPVSQLNKASIASSLAERGVSETAITKLIESLDQCEMARYAPIDVDEQTIFDTASEIITSIEEQVKK